MSPPILVLRLTTHDNEKLHQDIHATLTNYDLIATISVIVNESLNKARLH